MPVAKTKEPGVRELVLALEANTEFKKIVAVLERALTIKELPGIRGCAPCLSGLDRLVVQDVVLPAIR